MTKSKGINVLSLFDGISCGQQALKELGVKVNKYYASEINIHAIQIAYKNHPYTIGLGYVEDVKPKLLPKINLVLAGSPCQGFSSSGKGLNFSDPRSKLFFEFVRILKECQKLNPKVKFLLENVRMKKEWQDVISKHVGVEPVMVNSALVSAQTRHRLYWANFEIKQPEDLGIKVINILSKPYYRGLAGKVRTDTKRQINFNKLLNIVDLNGKYPCLTLGDELRAIPISMKGYRKITTIEEERLQTLPDNYTKGIPITHRHNGIANGWTVAVIKHILKPLKH